VQFLAHCFAYKYNGTGDICTNVLSNCFVPFDGNLLNMQLEKSMYCRRTLITKEQCVRYFHLLISGI
jgi:hypothetical protein